MFLRYYGMKYTNVPYHLVTVKKIIGQRKLLWINNYSKDTNFEEFVNTDEP